ncbi:hypothetical protein DAPPUDRAFT_245046 [Daphnia pulex]|uniref:Uncharacterized protein n=1 Tax=Daphnia pulex TaxID=6669 RepID=E9GMF8_DAPPU|nr:hypothetical protein DAPPUDRAFT_245046 [Daphnia pulex]|eukprot:EFX79401.1 hypothetical protein DAPPUDRAFT_245046 [Daphnia pulex]
MLEFYLPSRALEFYCRPIWCSQLVSYSYTILMTTSAPRYTELHNQCGRNAKGHKPKQVKQQAYKLPTINSFIKNRRSAECFILLIQSFC